MLKNILLATKFSSKAPVARELAIELAKALNARLYVLTVYNYRFVERAQFDITTIGEELKGRVRENVEKKLDDYIANFRKQGIEPVKMLKAGDAETQILNVAREIRANLIIIGAGTRKGMFLDRFVYNVSGRVQKHAPCHVLTVT